MGFRLAGIACVGFFVLYLVDLSSGSIKKGLCVDPATHLCDDFKVWHNVNWWYHWGENFWWLRHMSNCTTFTSNWVSMVWGWRPQADYPVYIPTESKFILGFNEPNHRSQSNLTPTQAAQHWKEIEWHSRGLPIVSPAAAPCGDTSQCHGNTVDWFDEFFKQCKGCRVDYLATHTYWCSVNTTMTYLEGLWNRYHKKIWLTEFACPSTNSAHAQLEFMKQILPRLESASYIYRYSWYQNRIKSDHGFVKSSASLLQPHSSTLTPLGHYYNNFHWRVGHHQPAVVG